MATPTPTPTATAVHRRPIPMPRPRARPICGAAMGMPVLEKREVDQRVFVIVLKSSLWGLHVEANDTDGCRKTQVVAFEQKRDAETMARRLWAHRLAAHKWPDTVLEGRPLWVRTADDVLITSDTPLKIDEVELLWLTNRMGKSDAAVSVVQPFEDEDDLTLRGRYIQATLSHKEKASWLKKMHQKQLRARD